MSLAAGELTQQIRIERRTGARAPSGQLLDVWEPVVTTWCRPAGQTGMGTITSSQGGVVGAINQYSLRIRYREGLDEGMRVVLLRGGLPMGEPMDIKAIRPDLAGRIWTDIVCAQGGNDG